MESDKINSGRPEVSFIVPAYNAAAHLEDALESLLRQRGARFEIVVVDDCSTDATPRIAAEYARRHPATVRVITMPCNSGCAYTPRRRGIEEARADIVAPLDSDDWVDEGYLEKLWRRMQETEADIVYPVMYKDYPDRMERSVPARDFDMERVWRGHDLVEHTLDGWRIGAAGGLVRRGVYTDCFARYRPVKSIFSDEVLTRQLLLRAGRVALCETAYHYRMQPESVTHRLSLSLFGFLEADRELVKLTRENFAESHPARIRAATQMFHHFFRGIRLLSGRGKFSRDERREAMRLLGAQLRLMDWKLITPHVSPRYRLLARAGVRASLLILPIYDRIKGS